MDTFSGIEGSSKFLESERSNSQQEDPLWFTLNGNLELVNWLTAEKSDQWQLWKSTWMGMGQEGVSGVMEMFCLISLINTDWRTHLRCEQLTVCKLYANFQKADVGSIVFFSSLLSLYLLRFVYFAHQLCYTRTKSAQSPRHRLRRSMGC